MSQIVVRARDTTFDPASGPFTSEQALAAGLTRWELSQLVRRHEVRRVLTNVYVPADEPDTLANRARAAGLVLPTHAVAVDGTAAWIWGVDVRRPSELDVPPRLEFFSLRGHTRTRRKEVAGGVRDLAPRDVVRVHGTRVTVPTRTCLDLACRRRRYEALAALDALARAQGVGQEELLRELPRFRGRRGVVQARELVALVDARSESQGESFVRLAIHDAGLPPPELQHWVMVMGIPTYRLDLAYVRMRICVEYDGEQFHSTPEQVTADERRREWLRGQGWIVIVVRKDGLKGALLDAWLLELRRALDERSR